MATREEKEKRLMESIEGKPIKIVSRFMAMRKKVLVRCLVCGEEMEKEPREMMRMKDHGCRICASAKHRKPNEVITEVGNVLVLDVSSERCPKGKMLIYKKKWEILQSKGIGRVSISGNGYPCAKFNKKKEFVHRILMGFPEAPEQVDHINGVKHDNRMSNLRIVTALENQMNRGMRKTNTSGVIGVSWSSAVSKWMAELRVGRKRVHRSYHDDIEDAATARKKAVQEHCGEYAPVNISPLA